MSGTIWASALNFFHVERVDLIGNEIFGLFREVRIGSLFVRVWMFCVCFVPSVETLLCECV